MQQLSKEAVRNILVVLPKRLGDALMCTPALNVLAGCFPAATIDAVAESALGGVVASHNPHVKKVLVTPENDQVSEISRSYQLGVNLHCAVNHGRDFLQLLKLANPAVELIYPGKPGKSLHQSVSNVRNLLSHLAQDFTEEAIPYQFEVTTDDRATLQKRLHSLEGGAVEKLIVFQLGCHGIQKNAKQWKFWKKMGHKRTWNWERFWALECELRKHYPDVEIILQGDGKERVLVEQYKKKSIRSVAFVDAGIGELAALLERCDCLVTPDTGTMHLGCAMGTPMVALFGPTSPECTGPYPPRDNIRILKGESLEEISEESVCTSVCELLSI